MVAGSPSGCFVGTSGLACSGDLTCFHLCEAFVHGSLGEPVRSVVLASHFGLRPVKGRGGSAGL